MKILHTGDWHIGQIFYNHDRSDEHRLMLGRIAVIAAQEQPDVMVVCGDIFHTAAPSTSSRKLYIEGLLKIHEAAPRMEIVVIAGNHDSGSRIEVDRLLWENFNVHAVGSAARQTEELGKHIIPVGNPIMGYVVAVPYSHPQNLPSLSDSLPVQERMPAFCRKLLDIVGEMNHDRLPVVLAAHATIFGGNPLRQEVTVGGLDSFDPDLIGDGYDYLALGHIHFPQKVGSRARYAGSPLPVSFNEDYIHSVTIAEIQERGCPVSAKVVELPAQRRVRTIPEEDAVDFEQALQMMKSLPDNDNSYVRLSVKARQYGGADWAERAVNAARDKMYRYCCMLIQREADPADSDGRTRFSREQFRTKSPAEIAMLHWREKTGEEMDPELVKLLEKAVAEASGEDC